MIARFATAAVARAALRAATRVPPSPFQYALGVAVRSGPFGLQGAAVGLPVGPRVLSPRGLPRFVRWASAGEPGARREMFDIKAPRVRVVGKDGRQVGVLETLDALELAVSQDGVLVEIQGRSDPPVCRLFGEEEYLRLKTEDASRTVLSALPAKELRLRSAIQAHDLDVKMRTARRILTKAHPLRLTINAADAHMRAGSALFMPAAEALYGQFKTELDELASANKLHQANRTTAQTVFTPRGGAVHEALRAKEAARETAKEERRASKPASPEEEERQRQRRAKFEQRMEDSRRARREAALALIARAREGQIVTNRDLYGEEALGMQRVARARVRRHEEARREGTSAAAAGAAGPGPEATAELEPEPEPEPEPELDEEVSPAMALPISLLEDVAPEELGVEDHTPAPKKLDPKTKRRGKRKGKKRLANADDDLDLRFMDGPDLEER